MHNHRPFWLPILALAAAASAAACDDPLAPDDPLIVDTAEIASIARTETTGMPSAFDFTRTPVPASVVVESPGAGGWDILLSERDGELVLVPAGSVPGQGDAALVLETSRAFNNVLEAPESAEFSTEPAPLRADAVYIVRSRPVSGCVFFAKLQPLEIDTSEDILRFEYVANPNCNIRKLGPVEDS